MEEVTVDKTKIIKVQMRDLIAALVNEIFVPLVTANGLKVSVAGGSAVINVDMAEVDVQALITGIANGKTLANVFAALGSPAQAGEAAAAVAELTGASLTFDRAYFDADGSGAIVAADPGKTARVHGLALVCSAAAELALTDSDGTVLYKLGTFAANGGPVLDPVAMAKLAYAEATAGKGLSFTVSAGTVTGYVLYSKE